MSQLNFYVPEALEKKIRAEAKKKKMTVSSFIGELVKHQMEGGSAKSSDKKALLDLGGAWKGDFPEMERHPPQDREGE